MSRIGFLSTRLAGTDGVSLETAKIATIARRLGHEVFYCAGELDADSPPGMLFPEMHFAHPEARRIHDEAFIGPAPADLRARIAAMAKRLKGNVAEFISHFQIDILFIENALTIPMQIPLGVALTDYIEETGLPTVIHNHDFYWERERFARCAVPEILERCFPPALPSARHLVINKLAQASLRARKGIEAERLPNIFDYATPPPEPDAYVADLRQALGLEKGDRVILQPTRVIPRKNIELAIELVRQLGDPHLKLVITHPAGDEGLEYLAHLRTVAREADVDLRYAADLFAPARQMVEGRKIHSLWDAYPLADLVTYPSTIEGFGNAFLEAVYFRRPLFVNRYPVYVSDLEPLGFRCAAVDNAITPEALDEVHRYLTDPAYAAEVTAHNYAVASAHFSFEAVTPLLERVLRF
ncbi:MAG: glycosyltransferase family 4 protein [Chloroflexi bacterium]|nr:glycosyltransferase family 4 protein [Chloroflexota bacterium]